MVRAAGVEPTTFGSGGRRSIQLSYARVAGVIIPHPARCSNQFGCRDLESEQVILIANCPPKGYRVRVT